MSGLAPLSNQTGPASGFARPSPASLLGSFCFHVLAIYGMLNVPIHPSSVENPKRPNNIQPTILKIGDKIYFVAKIPPDAEHKAEAAKAAPPKPKAVEPKPAPKAPEPPPAEVAQVQPKEAPRVFVPPQVHRNLVTESTLIQPMTPVDQVPTNVPLPSFRIQTPRPQRLTRQFVTP